MSEVGCASEVRVQGVVSAEELAAVLASLGRRPADAPPARYERWRLGRMAALRQTPSSR